MTNPFTAIDWDDVQPHPTAEKLSGIIAAKTQNDDPLFYRMCVTYYLVKVAATMHAKIWTYEQGLRPINAYVINLAPSGYGKNKGANILEDEVIHLFKQKILDETFEQLAQENVPKIAHKRAVKGNRDPDNELAKVTREFESLGPLAFSFCSATVPAVKQMRHKILMGGLGAINLEMDELGSNLTNNAEVFAAYLELFDQGKIKQKLVKNTNDSLRSEDIDGRTPTNMFAFGEPNKLLDGGKTEDDFKSLLDTGYARRCFFGFVRTTKRQKTQTADEIFDQLVNPQNDVFLEDLAITLEKLADRVNFGKEIQMTKENTLLMYNYMLHCQSRAEALPEFQNLIKKELSSRHDKALKLAGAYAFIDGSHEVTEEHLMAAFKLAEESGKCFEQILSNDFTYMRLARYIGENSGEMTHADLVEILPFYPKSSNQQKDILNLATQYGYKNNIIIKREFIDGIEFIAGESLKKTDISKMKVSYGTHMAYNYLTEDVPFEELHTLVQMDGYHWASHAFKDGHRCEDNVIPGFNMIVLDIDEGVSMATAAFLLKDYKSLIYTTKRHTPDHNRFRIILPMNYNLKLDGREFKEFMENFFEWLPFQCDTETAQRSRKWMSHKGHYQYNDGESIDVLPFIPKTKKNVQFKEQILDTQSMSNLERWFINNTGYGNRSNQLIKYAYILVDAGKSWDDVRLAVMELNSKLPNKLDDSEINGTIMVSVGKAIAKRDV